ncbi:MAG: hypothetical protein EBQ89_00325, partial [Alphaproteobacteria bacterium]|nr:hypothetical protein [Alphaproteobacteria bacterium]
VAPEEDGVEVAIVATPFVKDNGTGTYIITLPADINGQLNPDVNDTLNWKRNIAFDYIEYYERVVDSMNDILPVRCKEYIILDVSLGNLEHRPFEFTFVTLGYRPVRGSKGK